MKRFSGVGMVGGDLGSKVLNTKPVAGSTKDQKILLQSRIDSPPKITGRYPLLDVHVRMR
jgi:hypothetical protein